MSAMETVDSSAEPSASLPATPSVSPSPFPSAVLLSPPKTDGDGAISPRKDEDDELSHLAQYYARTLMMSPPTSPRLDALSSSSFPTFLRSHPALPLGRSTRGAVSALRASAPPFKASPTPPVPFPLTHTHTHTLSSDEWLHEDGGKAHADVAGRAVDYGAPFSHAFTTTLSPLLSSSSFDGAQRRPLTPFAALSSSSTLSAASAPFAPSSAPLTSRSLRDAAQEQLHEAHAVQPYPSPPSPASWCSSASVSNDAFVGSALGLPPLPALPFDVSSGAELAHERPEHAVYMLSFRTAVCPMYLAGACPHNAHSCFLSHSALPRRRKPLLQHGRFSYIPTRCRYLLDARDCPKGAQCRFAHVTEEVIYHPSKYKTQLCPHALDGDGCCVGYGRHCAKAHGERDRRAAVYEAEEGQPRRWSMAQLTDFAVPPEQREQDRLFYQFVYKTRRCAGFPWDCRCDGLDWHREEERRRGPAIRYAPMACPGVKAYLNSEWGDPAVDCSGRFAQLNAAAGKVVQWDCEYAHTLLELMYHPQVYKTSLCVAEGTLVHLGCGAAMQVERLCKGDVVMAFDKAEDGLRPTPVLAAIERESERDCVELRFEDGRTLLCTPDHRVLTEYRGWVKAQRLQVGQSRVRMSSVPPMLFSSSLHQDPVSRSFSLTLQSEPAMRFSCDDVRCCVRFCALARLLGYAASKSWPVEGGGCVVVNSQLDAERVVEDIRHITGETVTADRTPGCHCVGLPQCLLQSFSPRATAERSVGALCRDGVPSDLLKETVAAFLGAALDVRIEEEASSREAKGTRLAFAFEASSLHEEHRLSSVVGTLSQQLTARGLPRLRWRLRDMSGGPRGVVSVDDAIEWQSRVGVRYNSLLEAQLAALVTRIRLAKTAPPDQTDASATSVPMPTAAHASLPCFSLRLTGRREVGARRVFDLRVDGALHSFIASGIVAHNCDHFDERSASTWKCVWKRRCAHAHGRDDLKGKEHAAEEWKQHLALIGPATTQRRPSLHLSSTLQPQKEAGLWQTEEERAAARPEEEERQHSHQQLQHHHSLTHQPPPTPPQQLHQDAAGGDGAIGERLSRPPLHSNGSAAEKTGARHAFRARLRRHSVGGDESDHRQLNRLGALHGASSTLTLSVGVFVSL